MIKRFREATKATLKLKIYGASMTIAGVELIVGSGDASASQRSPGAEHLVRRLGMKPPEADSFHRAMLYVECGIPMVRRLSIRL